MGWTKIITEKTQYFCTPCIYIYIHTYRYTMLCDSSRKVLVQNSIYTRARGRPDDAFFSSRVFVIIKYIYNIRATIYRYLFVVADDLTHPRPNANKNFCAFHWNLRPYYTTMVVAEAETDDGYDVCTQWEIVEWQRNNTEHTLHVVLLCVSLKYWLLYIAIRKLLHVVENLHDYNGYFPTNG